LLIRLLQLTERRGEPTLFCAVYTSLINATPHSLKCKNYCVVLILSWECCNKYTHSEIIAIIEAPHPPLDWWSCLIYTPTSGLVVVPHLYTHLWTGGRASSIQPTSGLVVVPHLYNPPLDWWSCLIYTKLA
jgi:hypothetical protein